MRTDKTLVASLTLLSVIYHLVKTSESIDYPSSLGSLFGNDQTCASASPSSLGWAYHLFGNTQFSQALQKIPEWQLAADPKLLAAVASDVRSTSCVFGICDSTTQSCKCSRNWKGTRCQNCAGRTLWSQNMNGYLASNAPALYPENSRCTWIITPPSDSKGYKLSLSLRLLNFSTECSWDLLFIFDGTAAVSSNLLAVVSGDFSSEQLELFPTLHSKYGAVMIYFYSDAYLNYGGFILEYSYSYCDKNCSGRGDCRGGPLNTMVYTMTVSPNALNNSVAVTQVTGPTETTTLSSATTTGQLTTVTTTLAGAVPVSNSPSPTCECQEGYRGASCEFLSCPNNCSAPVRGSCRPDGTCACRTGFAGEDCSIGRGASSGYFDLFSIQQDADESFTFLNKAPASSGAAVVTDNRTIWLFGGFDFGTRFNAISVRKYDILTQTFEYNMTISTTTNTPIFNRYGLSALQSRQYPEVIYIFGGTLTWSNRITPELWSLNLTSLRASPVNGYRVLSNSPRKPLPAALTGHTAHLVYDTAAMEERLLVFFGYSPDYGLSDWLRIYHFNSSTWRTEQSPYAGRAWHSSIYDEETGAVFIYGGFAATPRRASVDITGDLIRYDIESSSWSYVGQLPHKRAFHSAILVPGSRHMLIHGGTMHETTTSSRNKNTPEQGLCYVARPLVLDLDSGCSNSLNDSQFSARLGHIPIAAWNNSKEILYFGGFDGTIIDDAKLVKFTPLPCESRSTFGDCLRLNGYACQWACDHCYPVSAIVPGCDTVMKPYSYLDKINTAIAPNSTVRSCGEKTSCMSCTTFRPSDSESCIWYQGDVCMSLTRSTTTLPTASTTFSSDDIIVDAIPISSIAVSSPIYTQQTQTVIRDPDQCPTSCYALGDCYSCSRQNSCLWCNTLALCLPSDAYRIAFPYGQCQDWTMSPEQCRTNCSSYHTCSDCQQDLRCGWCDDGSETGTGTCMVGGLSAALNASTLNAPGCPSSRWYFSKCPLCQCSGHSACFNGTDKCIACEDNTEGERCEKCMSGYYGSALNGGICQPCQCNGHATYCDNQTGSCKCDTQGVGGDRCDKCDKSYEGDPVIGTCYYPIQAGYRYTMDLTKKDMIYINKINFQTKDKLGRNEVNFKLNCSRLANYVLTYAIGKEVNSTETILQQGICGPDLPQVEISVSPTSSVPFSEPNFRFRIGISNFTHPFLITLVATEEQPFLIYLLLIAVFGCFLVVLVIAIIVFQIKRRYDDYHRRQQVKIELKRMAKRPFAMINFQLQPTTHPLLETWEGHSANESAGSSSTKPAKRGPHPPPPMVPRSSPMPVTLQPLATPGAAIMTVLIQLPLVAANPTSTDRVENSSEVSLGAPSAIAAGSVIVRAASNLLSDLSNRNRQPQSPQTTSGNNLEPSLCVSSAAAQTASGNPNNTTHINNDSTVSPIMASGDSRRSSRQTCWNTPPGSISGKPPGLRIGSSNHQSGGVGGNESALNPPAPAETIVTASMESGRPVTVTTSLNSDTHQQHDASF